MPRAYGFDEEGFKRVREAVSRVMGSPRTGAQRRRQPPVLSGGGPCGYYHQFVIVGGSSLPTSGSQIYTYTIGLDTEDITIEYNMTHGELKTEFLTEFPSLSGSDLESSGGPWPQLPLEMKFTGDAAGDVAAGSPPVVGTNTLNNDCWGAIWPVPAWGG